MPAARNRWRGPALHEAIAARLRASSQRYSPGRRALIGLLAATQRPLTSPEIVARDTQLSLSSVYRNLTLLERVGVVRRIVTQEDNARFELAEAFSAHHHHLICDRCGGVADYAPPPQLERAIAKALAAMPRAARFAPRSHHLQVNGLCASCAGPARRR